jgi:hypothetical protein
MKKETQAKWTDRFLRKLSIEDALADFNLQLDQAIQSFQVQALLVRIGSSTLIAFFFL